MHRDFSPLSQRSCSAMLGLHLPQHHSTEEEGKKFTPMPTRLTPSAEVSLHSRYKCRSPLWKSRRRTLILLEFSFIFLFYCKKKPHLCLGGNFMNVDIKWNWNMHKKWRWQDEFPWLSLSFPTLQPLVPIALLSLWRRYISPVPGSVPLSAFPPKKMSTAACAKAHILFEQVRGALLYTCLPCKKKKKEKKE